MNSHFKIPLNEQEPATFEKAGFWAYLKKNITAGKLNTLPGALLLLAVVVLVGYSVPVLGFMPGISIIVFLIAIPFLYSIIAYPQFGISVVMIFAYLLMWVIKWGVGFPLGTLMDGLQLFLMIGLLLKIKYKPVGDLYKNPVTYWIVVWIVYNLLQVGNPFAESRLSWVYTIRSVAIVMIMYFIFIYHINTEAFLKFIIKLWLGLSVFAAMYAMWQEYIGFLPFEQADLANPDVRQLLLIDGHWRKFSIFSDPVAFSYNMVASSLLCIGLLSAPLSRTKKRIVLGCCLLFLYTMLFSGTRGAYALVPLGLVLLAVLKFNKKVFYLSLLGLAVMLTLIFMPTSNYTLYRFQTAFKPSNDNSFKLRQYNQKRIQPFILSHPIGAGLGAAGAWGRRFSPNSFLANFEVDSGYVRVAVELGWVGLLIFCTLMFVVIKTCVNNYFKIRDPMLKSICLSMALITFALAIGNYPQEAFVQFPTNIYIYLVIALSEVTLRLDKEKNKTIAV